MNGIGNQVHKFEIKKELMEIVTTSALRLIAQRGKKGDTLFQQKRSLALGSHRL